MHTFTCKLSLGYFCAIVSIEAQVFKCKYSSVSVQVIFRKNPSQCFRQKKGERRKTRKGEKEERRRKGKESKVGKERKGRAKREG